MKIKALVGVLTVASSMTLAPVTAQAATAPAPTADGVVSVAPGQSATFNTTLADGTPETVTIDAGAVVKAPWPAGMAHPLSATSGCWSAKNTITYGFSGIKGTFTQTSNWCGNPTTHRMLGMATQVIQGNVQAGGQALGWSYEGVTSQTITPYYNSDSSMYANQTYAEGRFKHCLAIKVACIENKYPQTWTNVYPDGATNFFAQS